MWSGINEWHLSRTIKKKRIKYICVPLHAKYFPKTFFLLFRFLYLPRYKTYRSSAFFNIAIFSLISNIRAVLFFLFFFFQFLVIISFFFFSLTERDKREGIFRVTEFPGCSYHPFHLSRYAIKFSNLPLLVRLLLLRSRHLPISGRAKGNAERIGKIKGGEKKKKKEKDRD